MPYISRSSIQEVTDRMDASAIVSEYVRLEKRGGRLWACCPFHQEKTASFTVNPELKSFYCFGCHKGGSLINFVMELDKLSFPEAIEHLAKKIGVELVYENSPEGNYGEDEEGKKKKEALFELYQRISGTFHHFLLKKPEAKPAMLYIISRGISINMIEHFTLGYAPFDRYWLHKFLLGKGYSADFLASSGLFSSRGDTRASFFSGRLMFPINNQQGKTVAFGGRFLDLPSVERKAGWEPPKYINSPELEIYKKREALYALDLALPEIRRTKTAYIAEGYLDVIALHQAGITNSIAPLGTSFTEEQARLLKRWIEKLVFFFDSDKAGQEAIVRGIYTCRKNALACAVVMPEAAPQKETDAYKDPADILKDSGPMALKEKANNVVSDFNYLLIRSKSLAAGFDSKAKAITQLFPYIKLLDSEAERVSCIETAADAFELLPAAVAEDFNRYLNKNENTEYERIHDGIKLNPIHINDELSLLVAVALDFISRKGEGLFLKFRSVPGINSIGDLNAREIFIALEECVRYGETGMDEFLSRISSPELREFIIERSVSGEFSINPDKIVTDGVKMFKMKDLEQRQEEIILKLRLLKKNKNTKAQELLSEKMQIDNELHRLKQGSLT